MVNVLGYFVTIDRSLYDLCQMSKYHVFELFQLLTLTSHSQPEHHLKPAITASQTVLGDLFNEHQPVN